MATPPTRQRKPIQSARKARRRTDIVPEGLAVNLAAAAMPDGPVTRARRAVSKRGRRIARAAGKAAKAGAAKIGSTIAEEDLRKGSEALEADNHAVVSIDELVRRKPVKALGAALLAGLVLGFLSKGK